MKIAFLLPLLLAGPAAAQNTNTFVDRPLTDLDLAAQVCRSHTRDYHKPWRPDSEYEEREYAEPCAKVYQLWIERETKNNLIIIQRAIDADKPQ